VNHPTVALDPDTEIDVAPAGLFDALEEATAPRFVEELPQAAVADMAAYAADGDARHPGAPLRRRRAHDPVFVPDPEAPDVDNVHAIGPRSAGVGLPVGAVALGMGLLGALIRRRSR
jgi:hypothetical protein